MPGVQTCDLPICYVAGALGPQPRTASISPDVNDPGARNIDFEALRQTYSEQLRGLLDGGIDVILVETIFDTLNAKAAIFAIEEAFEARGKRWPVMISGTVTDASGRILSGQTVEAFWNAILHARPMTVGLNCALGAALMRPYVQELSQKADTLLCVYPNAGLPNPMSDTGFDETPDVTSRLVHEFAAEGLVTITPRRGAVVTQLTKGEFLEAYQVREVLETLGARLAVPAITDGELARMDGAIARMGEAAERRDVDLFFDANNAFHGVLMAASRNRKLVEIHERLDRKSTRLNSSHIPLSRMPSSA